MRTTVNIDDRILKDLKKIQKQEKQSLGRLISYLLAQALGERQSVKRPAQTTRWISKPMGVRIDLADREAVCRAMEQGTSSVRSSKKNMSFALDVNILLSSSS